jgi:hypothetical protein
MDTNVVLAWRHLGVAPNRQIRCGMMVTMKICAFGGHLYLKPCCNIHMQDLDGRSTLASKPSSQVVEVFPQLMQGNCMTSCAPSRGAYIRLGTHPCLPHNGHSALSKIHRGPEPTICFHPPALFSRERNI